MAADYTKGLLRDYQNLILLLEKRSSEKKKLGLEINMLKNEVREQKEIISQKDEKIEKLELEVKRLKNNKSKDSTNSSIPTNKNSYTQVKNSRKKSDKKLGGQEGHEGFTLDVDKIQELISSGRVDLEIIETINEQISIHIFPFEIIKYCISRVLNSKMNSNPVIARDEAISC